MDYAEKAMELHRKLRGKLEMHTRTETGTREALSIAYTPGVAAPCLAIKEDPAQSYELTRRWNTVAVVTDGTAVLGLGDIGPEAGMPVSQLLLYGIQPGFGVGKGCGGGLLCGLLALQQLLQ